MNTERKNQSKNLKKDEVARQLQLEQKSNVEDWGKQTNTIILTNNQIVVLASYIFSSSHDRLWERKSSEKILKEKKEGTVKFEKAKATVKYYLELERELQSISKVLHEWRN